MEHLHRGLQLVLRQGEHVRVRGVREHDRVALQGALQGTEVVAQPGRPLEVELGGGGAHLRLQTSGEALGVAGEEVGDVVDELPVLLGAHPPDAGRRALADVAEQAGSPDLGGPLEHSGAAGPYREHAQQLVDRLPDRPGVGVRPEVPGALLLRTAKDLHPRVLLAHGDGEPGIGLVVAVLDVEPRVELLDPGVLQLQRLDLGADDRPLDPGRGEDHLLRARVQASGIGEVAVEPLTQALGLAYVDDPAVGVGELVDPRLVRDLPRRRSVGRRVRHLPSPQPALRARRAGRCACSGCTSLAR